MQTECDGGKEAQQSEVHACSLCS